MHDAKRDIQNGHPCLTGLLIGIYWGRLRFMVKVNVELHKSFVIVGGIAH